MEPGEQFTGMPTRLGAATLVAPRLRSRWRDRLRLDSPASLAGAGLGAEFIDHPVSDDHRRRYPSSCY